MVLMTRPYDITGYRITDHQVDVPVDWQNPERFGSISVFVREVVKLSRIDDGLPPLIFLQGGPGGASPRPPHNTWIEKATDHYRVLLLDQRGTGRSTPITGRFITDFTAAHGGGVAGTKAAADYVACFRADAIADDVAHLCHVLNSRVPWTTLGQSFGGFITLSLLSRHPETVSKAMTTGGILAIDRTADDLYDELIPLQTARHDEFRTRFPDDQDLFDGLADRAAAGELVTLSGDVLSVGRLQLLGGDFGMSTGVENLHWMLDTAIEADGKPSQKFIEATARRSEYAGDPLYWTLQEGCYHQGHRDGGWGAWNALQRQPEYARTARPLLTFAEFAQPWMFTEIRALRAFAGVAEELAGERTWPQLWDADQLARNDVPLAAVQYTRDPYVGLAGAQRTLAHVGNSQLWETDDYLHDGLRLHGDTIVPELMRMLGVL
jgi:pimeloyl-ACP methyl ester carboxylesterase